MSFSIHPIDPSDVPTLAHILSLVYRDNPRTQAMLPYDMTDEQRQEHEAYRTDMIQTRSSQPNRYFFKAVETLTGQIVGYSGWFGPEERDVVPKAPNSQAATLPAFVNRDVLVDQEKKIKAMRSQMLGDRKDVWFLQAMSVHPSFQRRGVASQLIKHGLETIIDTDRGGTCYLESSPEARQMYRKHGFVDKAVIPFLNDSHEMTVMMRERRRGMTKIAAID